MFLHWFRICSIVFPWCLFFVCVVSFLFVSLSSISCVKQLKQIVEPTCSCCAMGVFLFLLLLPAVLLGTSSTTKIRRRPRFRIIHTTWTHRLSEITEIRKTSVKVAPRKIDQTLSISYFIWFPILQLKMKLLQAPWTARIRRLPTLMPLTSKRSARNAKHMAMTVVWVPFFRRRAKMTSMMRCDKKWTIHGIAGKCVVCL